MGRLGYLISLVAAIGTGGAIAGPVGIGELVGADILPQGSSESTWVSVVAQVDELDARADANWRSLKTRAEYDAHRKVLKEKMLAAMGEFPARTPLEARTVSVVEKDGYRVEKVIFQSMPGIFVTANLFIPEGRAERSPAVVMSCGHSRLGKDCSTYLRACLLLVRRGIVAFMFDPYEQGERVLHPDMRPTDAHNNIGVKAMLLGWSMPMLRIWDAIRAVDYITTRPEVDGRRIGYMGQSGGGTLTALMTAVDDRLVATAPSCYLTNLRQLCRHLGPQDAEQNIFGQLAFGLNHAGYVLLPDAKVCLTGRMSDFFPYEGALETGRVVDDVASMLGCRDHYAMNFAPGEHGWTESTMTASADWMSAWLCARRDILPLDMAAYRRLDIGRAGIGELALGNGECGVVDGGSVFGLKGALSIHDVLRMRKRRLAMKRKSLSADERAETVRRLAGVRRPGEGRLEPRVLDEFETNGVRVCRMAFAGADGLSRPAVLMTPAAADETAEPVLMTGAAGRKSFVADIAAALREGRQVMVADAFACGEIRGPARIGGEPSYFYGAKDEPEEGVAVMLYLMGESLVGRRATDILVFADHLSKRTGKAPRLLATGSVAVAAAHAFAAMPGMFSSVEVRGTPPSWDEYAESDNGRGRLHFTSCVNGAMAHYDWTDLLPKQSTAPCVETAYWQGEIDRTSRSGGGTVSVPAGEHLTGGLYLRDNVTLNLEKGCTLRGVADPLAYPPNEIPNVEIPQAEAWRAIVTAVGVTNVAVTGEGEIFGDGTRFPSDAKLDRPRGLLFYRCRGVRGASMTDVRVRNVEIEETAVPLFVRLGARRHRRYRGEDLPMPFGRNPGIENVLIENVRALATSAVASSITGVPEFRVKNVVLRHVEFSCPASGVSRAVASRPVPECADRKPGASMFECQVLPAYGLYARHVDGLMLENVTFKIREGVEERDALVTDDCTGVVRRGCSLQNGRPARPGTVVGRIGIVTDRETMAGSFRRFSDERYDLVIVDGIVGGQTSDTELLGLRALRDRYFGGPDRREVVYRYSGPVTMRQQELLDANGNVAFRDQKGLPVAVISSGIDPSDRTLFLDRTVKPHLRGVRDALVFDGKADLGGTIEIRR